MKRISSKTAFSLLELIIATMLIIVIILGLLSINFLLKSNNQDYGQRYLVRSTTQTTLNHILNNASLAIGSGINLAPSGSTPIYDKGIIIGGSNFPGDGSDFANTPGTWSLCIHQDIPPPPYASPTTIDSAPPNTTPSTPADYSNTRWLCYTFYSPVASAGNCQMANTIYYCATPYVSDGTIMRGAGVCNLSPGNTNEIFLGAAYSISNLNGNTSSLPSFSFDASQAGGQVLFTITIQNCLDNSQSSGNCASTTSTAGTCSSSGNSSDSADNPEVQLTGSASPSQQNMKNCSPAASC